MDYTGSSSSGPDVRPQGMWGQNVWTITTLVQNGRIKKTQYFHPSSGINHSGPRPDIRPEGMWGQNGHRPLRVATTGWRSWEGATLAEWCVSSSGDCRLTTGRAPTMWTRCVKIVRREVATMGMWGNEGVRGHYGHYWVEDLPLPPSSRASPGQGGLNLLAMYLQKFTL